MFDGATSFHQDLTSWPSNAKDDKYFCNDGAICNHSLKKTTNWALIDSLTVVSIALLGIFFYYEFHYCSQNDSAQRHGQIELSTLDDSNIYHSLVDSMGDEA